MLKEAITSNRAERMVPVAISAITRKSSFRQNCRKNLFLSHFAYDLHGKMAAKTTNLIIEKPFSHVIMAIDCRRFSVSVS